jgi:chemotaxis protein MotA
MDIAALLGFIGAVGMILAAMIAGGGVAPFVDNQSILIVFGGSFFAVMYTAPMPTFLASFKAMGKCFKPGLPKLDETVERMVELAGMARKDGMMALEGQPVPDKFFEKGMQMLVDGADEQKLIKQMNSEIASMKGRHAETTGCITSWVDIAPADGHDRYAYWSCFDVGEYGRSKIDWSSYGCCSFDNTLWSLCC